MTRITWRTWRPDGTLRNLFLQINVMPALEKVTNTWVHKPESGGINKCSGASEKHCLCAGINGTNFSDGAGKRKVACFSNWLFDKRGK